MSGTASSFREAGCRLARAAERGRAFARRGGTLLLAVAARLGWFVLRDRDGKALPATKLLAILPATDLTGREDGRQLCDGVSFSLGVKLQSVPGLSIMRPSGPAMLKETDPAMWARDTGANLLVQPAVRQMGDTRQLSFSVFLAGSPVQIAAGEVTGPAAEHFRLEDELTQKLTAALRIHLAGGGRVPAPGLPRVAPGAGQTDYVVALGYLERYDDKDSVQKAIDLLTRIPDGENSALVQAALGRAYLASYNLSKDVSAPSLAQKAAQRAIALDPDLPEAQVTLGQILTATGRSGEAITVIRKALDRDPSSVPAILALAAALQKGQDLVGAEQTLLRLVELRPTSWAGFNRLGSLYFLSSRYEKAAEAYRRAIALNPDVARVHFNLGAVLLHLGRFEEARAALDDSIRISPGGNGVSPTSASRTISSAASPRLRRPFSAPSTSRRRTTAAHRPRRRALADPGRVRARARRVRGGAPARDGGAHGEPGRRGEHRPPRPVSRPDGSARTGLVRDPARRRARPGGPGESSSPPPPLQ